MKEKLIKFICFFTGAEWRKFFPERWDLSKVVVLKEYGGNEGFVDFYKNIDNRHNFLYIDFEFYVDSFVVKGVRFTTRNSYGTMTYSKDLED
jgi:hypothetical protein